MEPLLKMQGVCKSFYGTQVLKEVAFELRIREVHALLGENGAGKSTLIKIISGAYKLDAGVVTFKGQNINYGPKGAEDLGIVTIYQNFHLVPHLNVAENLALRQLTSEKGWRVDWTAVYRQARVTLEKLNFPIDPRSKVKDLSIARQQMLEIAIALSKRAEVIVMDEPTAALSRKEIETLFGIIRQLKADGISVIYVSHKLEEIKEIGDRVTILRDGRNVATLGLQETELKEIIRLMIGREVTASAWQEERPGKAVVLALQGVTSRSFGHPLNLTVREHEVVGVTGLVGAGKTELARVLFGIDRIEGGNLYLQGKEVGLVDPRAAVTAGIGYLPEDRDGKGLCLNLGVRENLTLALLAKLKQILLNRASEKKLVSAGMKSVQIRAAGMAQKVKYLSGGNKQKVVFGKWLEAGCQVLILDEPTTGIDVGARKELYDLVHRFVEKTATAVVFISSDVNEILEVADRVLVMSNYRIVAELDAQHTDKQSIVEHSMRLIS
ncbi:MAG TPA: sugar ABC transporter ATP-binding protein [Chthoniobacterales bacterium]